MMKMGAEGSCSSGLEVAHSLEGLDGIKVRSKRERGGCGRRNRNRQGNVQPI